MASKLALFIQGLLVIVVLISSMGEARNLGKISSISRNNDVSLCFWFFFFFFKLQALLICWSPFYLYISIKRLLSLHKHISKFFKWLPPMKVIRIVRLLHLFHSDLLFLIDTYSCYFVLCMVKFMWSSHEPANLPMDICHQLWLTKFLNFCVHCSWIITIFKEIF